MTADASIVDHIERLVEEERRLHDWAHEAPEGRARLEAIGGPSRDPRRRAGDPGRASFIWSR